MQAHRLLFGGFFLDSDEWKRGLDFGHLGASSHASLLASVLISDFCFGDGLKEDCSETVTRVEWIMVHGSHHHPLNGPS